MNVHTNKASHKSPLIIFLKNSESKTITKERKKEGKKKLKMIIITFHRTLIVVLAVIIGSSTLTLAEPRRLLEESAAAKKKHESWASSKGKVYASAAEKEKRGKIFKTNLDFIEKFNANPKRSFKLKANKFADQSKDEFHKSRTGGFKMTNLTREVTSATMSFPAAYKTLDNGDYSSDSASIPSTVDWRNAVNPIRNQGECGKQ